MEKDDDVFVPIRGKGLFKFIIKNPLSIIAMPLILIARLLKSPKDKKND